MELVNIAFTTSVTVPVYQGFSFKLSDFATYTSYTALFDQYRIDQIELWLEPMNDSTTTVTTGLVSCIDLDDASTPASIGECSQRPGALAGTTLTGRYHKWRPHVAVAEYSGAFTSFGNEPSGWIDSNSPAVQHYGVKVATFGADGVARVMQATTRALVSFRSAHI